MKKQYIFSFDIVVTFFVDAIFAYCLLLISSMFISVKLYRLSYSQLVR